MAWNASVLTAVLLGLVVPPAIPRSLAAGPGPRGAAQGFTQQVAERPQTRTARRRDEQSAARPVITREMVGGASDYLRCRAEGTKAPADALAAWEAFFPKCDQLIRSYSNKLAGRGVDADDCAQEVWSQLTKILPTFELNSTRGQFGSWLYTVVRSKATDLHRRNTRHSADPISPELAATLPGTDGDPVLAVDRKLDVQEVRTALAKLAGESSEQSYRVLHLRHIDGLSVNEVARELDITPEQVWARDHRMRAKLRQLLLADAQDA